MKLVLLSDTHNTQPNVPNGDVLIHCGDFSNTGSFVQVQDQLNWLDALPHKTKIVIAGNHDYALEKFLEKRDLLASLSTITYLENSGVEVEGVKFWGSPINPPFMNWAFQPPRFNWEAAIPKDVEVLITHAPPFGILDSNSHFSSIGCPNLLEAVRKLPKLRIHVFGHVHENMGTKLIDGTLFINCALGGRLSAKPIEVQL